MEKISTSDTGTSVIASAAYVLPFATWIFGPILFYFEFRKKSAFITFHSLYSLGTTVFASIALALPPIIGLPFLAIAGLLWLYGIVACAFGTTPLLFRRQISRLAGINAEQQAFIPRKKRYQHGGKRDKEGLSAKPIRDNRGKPGRKAP